MSDDKPVLTADRVTALFRECLADDGIPAAGIIRNATFSSSAISARRDEIRDMLAELPDQFRGYGLRAFQLAGVRGAGAPVGAGVARCASRST
jgi:hypothetical protein